MSEKPLNEYIDMEAYDVVSGDQYRALKEQLEVAERALREISAVRLPTDNAVGRDELKGCHQARIAMQTIAREALTSFPANSPLADEYPPPEDVERAGELARDRGWRGIGGQGVVSDPAKEPDA